MPQFSKLSRDKLATCDVRLQRVFNEVIRHFDCTVLCGSRGKEEQDEAVRTGASQKKWPTGEHNKKPSRAVDVVPYPINWNDVKRMYYFAGIVVGIAKTQGVKLRWGGDWDQDTQVNDQTFNDLPHFEVED